MSGKTFLFRVDGCSTVGLGHLMRCRTLARRLHAEGLQAVFINRQSPILRATLKSEPIEVYEVLPETDELTIARSIEERFEGRSIGGIVVDLPADLSEEAATVYAGLAPLALLDDHGPARQRASLVINAIAHPDQEEQVDLPGRYLTGAEFIILDRAYHTPRQQRERGSGLRLLLAMGAADPHDITSQAAEALKGLPDDIDINALLGPAYSHRESFYGTQASLGRPLAITQNLQGAELPAFLESFDLAVMSFGLTVYGAAFLGLPAVVLSHNDAGHAAARQFARRYDCCRYLDRYDRVTDEQLLQTVQQLLEDREARKKLGAAGMDAVDGDGLERVTRRLLELVQD